MFKHVIVHLSQLNKRLYLPIYFSFFPTFEYQWSAFLDYMYPNLPCAMQKHLETLVSQIVIYFVNLLAHD
jgi:hypothetical protein